MAQGAAECPAWTGIRLVESRAIRYGRVDEIPRSALRTVAEYESRFEALFTAGYAWINVSALGVFEGELLVCIELPRDTSSTFGRTSVNLSGPTLDVRSRSTVWDVAVRTRFVDTE